MPVILPPSMSRIYIHNVTYKGKNSLNREDADAIINLILRCRSTAMKELQFQGIKIINIHHLNSTSSEIHIGNVMYYIQRVLTIDLIDKLRRELAIELRKNTDFNFEQINVVNDEYVVAPTAGYYDGE